MKCITTTLTTTTIIIIKITFILNIYTKFQFYWKFYYFRVWIKITCLCFQISYWNHNNMTFFSIDFRLISLGKSMGFIVLVFWIFLVFSIIWYFIICTLYMFIFLNYLFNISRVCLYLIKKFINIYKID